MTTKVKRKLNLRLMISGIWWEIVRESQFSESDLPACDDQTCHIPPDKREHAKRIEVQTNCGMSLHFPDAHTYFLIVGRIVEIRSHMLNVNSALKVRLRILLHATGHLQSFCS